MATTTISVLRPEGGDPYEPTGAAPTLVGTVAGHLSSPGGRNEVVGGEQEVIDLELVCNPIAMQHTDLVRDETTDVIYTVVWCHQRYGLGLDHVKAGLRIVEGAA
jgi:hypothetical protein